MNLRYKCLVFDHDDTTVNSTTSVHYPSFVEYMKLKKPTYPIISLEEYVKLNFNPGIIELFTKYYGFSEEDFKEEELFWMDYTHKHVSEVFPGIREIMEAQKAAGGLIAVVSHSFADNITRDYEHNRLPTPDMVFGWEQPKAERKPAPTPLYKIMARYGLKASDILVLDDLKPGLDMARAAGCDFAAAGWCFDIPENERYMRENADFYFKTVAEFSDFLINPSGGYDHVSFHSL